MLKSKQDNEKYLSLFLQLIPMIKHAAQSTTHRQTLDKLKSNEYFTQNKIIASMLESVLSERSQSPHFCVSKTQRKHASQTTINTSEDYDSMLSKQLKIFKDKE